MSNYRNAVLILADDWSRLAGCYGSPVIRTPRIDEFAQCGVVFDNAFCTSPSCAVSRACILTGQHSHTHGQYGHCHGIQGFRTHRWMSSISLDFRAAGFATACIGKKHVEPAEVYPFEFNAPDQSGAAMVEATRRFLAENAQRPFYLHLGLTEPHREGLGYGNERDHPLAPPLVYAPEEVIVPPFLPDVPAVRGDLAAYYQAVSRFDAIVGALLDEIERSGRADETLIIVSTDHAMPFPGAKASMFDSGHHCPFIVRAGANSPIGRNNAMMNWTNIRPTIHHWCGVAASTELLERSVLPILGEPNPAGWDETFFSHCFHEVMDYNPYRVLRGRRYKFVRHLAPGLKVPFPTDLYRSPTWTAVRERDIETMGARPTSHIISHAAEELYDLQADPVEAVNRIDDPALQNIAREMRQKLIDFRVETKDPWLEVDFQEGRLDFDPLRIGVGS